MPRDDYSALPKAQLFARLAQGLAGGVTVLTPNRRLAQALAREFDAGMAAQGRSSWESADVLPYAAFVERCYEDALYSDGAPNLPVLLTPAEERVLWEEVIRRSAAGEALLALPETAALAAAAWTTAHAWGLLDCLRSGQLNEDANAFRDWCAHYSRRCERDGNTDAARLPDLVAACANGSGLRKPKQIVLYGFDLMTPQQQALFDALRSAGTQVFVSAQERREARVRSQLFKRAGPTDRLEDSMVAHWYLRRDARQCVIGDAQQRHVDVVANQVDVIVRQQRGRKTHSTKGRRE